MLGQFDPLVRFTPHQDQQAGYSIYKYCSRCDDRHYDGDEFHMDNTFFVVQTNDSRDDHGYHHDVYYVNKLMGDWPPAKLLAHAIDSGSFGGGYAHHYTPPPRTLPRATLHVYTD